MVMIVMMVMTTMMMTTITMVMMLILILMLVLMQICGMVGTVVNELRFLLSCCRCLLNRTVAVHNPKLLLNSFET